MTPPTSTTEKEISMPVKTAPTDSTDRDTEKGDHIERLESHRIPNETFKLTLGKYLAISGLLVGFLANVFNQLFAQNSMVKINTAIATVPAPFIGYLSDIYGRRNFILIGSVLAFIGTAVSANVSTIPRLYGASAIIGAGACLHQLAIPALCEIVPRRWRPFAIGCFAIGLASGTAFGPVIAASIMVHHSWRVLYWVPFAVNILAFFLTFLFYHPTNQYVKGEGKKSSQQALHLDWVGGFLFVIGATIGLLGTTFGTSPKTLGTLVSGLCMLFGTIPYGYVMRNRLSYALFPNTIFSQYRQYTVFLWPIFFCSLVFGTTVVIWPQQVQLLYTQDSVKAGWYVSAPSISAVLVAPVYGILLQRFARFSRWILTFLVFTLTLLAACQAIVSPTSSAASTALVCLMGVVYSGIVVGFTSYMQLVPHRWLGTSFQFDEFLRVIASSGAALCFPLILTNKLTDLLPKDVAIPLAEAGVNPSLIPQVIDALTTGSSTSPVLGELSPQQLGIAVLGIQKAFISSFRIIYYSTIALGVPCIFLVALSRSFDNLLGPEVELKLLEGLHINPKTDTGEGVIIPQGGRWL
ncbi:MFS general substrate transporter [Glonium stellatum]|uniref:MFS general substrate transporter n=1 Tax=Glonium stellatum TaxID=574774 RepID=A0A8E2JWW4_9PEZI|nr:MFS general substrate transporter [Glonium stellatum]